MSRITQKKVTFIILITLGFLLISYGMSNFIAFKHAEEMFRLKSSILGVVLNQAPELEGAVIDAYMNIEEHSGVSGQAALNRVGLNSKTIVRKDFFSNFSKNIFVYYVMFTITLLLIIVLFCIYDDRQQKKALNELVEYLEAVNMKNYSLDLRDNQEGVYSLLKNNIYKVTSMLKESNKDLVEERNELSKAISDISHQIKTPLTSIQILTDVLRKGSLPEEKEVEFHKALQGQISRMNWLVSSLLKLAKFDAKTIDLKKDKIYISDLINKMTELFMISIEVKDINLVVKENLEASFYGDFDWTIEALSNIFKNCLEHSDEGGSIKIEYDENPLYTEIVILDEGKGIDKEDLPYIFKRFYKGKNSANESVGIGLALTKSIVESQSGVIKVDSHVGKGTKFAIRFYKNII
jgi:signal transduction histidine kinase